MIQGAILWQRPVQHLLFILCDAVTVCGVTMKTNNVLSRFFKVASVDEVRISSDRLVPCSRTVILFMVPADRHSLFLVYGGASPLIAL